MSSLKFRALLKTHTFDEARLVRNWTGTTSSLIPLISYLFNPESFFSNSHIIVNIMWTATCCCDWDMRLKSCLSLPLPTHHHHHLVSIIKSLTSQAAFFVEMIYFTFPGPKDTHAHAHKLFFKDHRSQMCTGSRTGDFLSWGFMFAAILLDSKSHKISP